MEQLIKETLSNIGQILEKEGYIYEIVQPKKDRITLSINERMRDVGMAPGNSVMDLFFEENTKTIFIGMLRIPKKIRGKKLTNQFISFFKEIANENGYTIMVDACDGCDLFWRHQGFKFIFHDKVGYDILGFSKENKNHKSKWEEFIKTEVYQENLSFHQ